MTSIDGKTLSRCFDLVSRCGRELKGLDDMLAHMLREHLPKVRGILPCVWDGNISSNSRMDDSEWVYTDTASNFPLKAKGSGNNSVERYLGYQISMMGDGIEMSEMSDNSEPLLHVFCWGSPVNFRDQDYVGFPFDHDDVDPLAVIDDRLVFWGDIESSEWNNRAWVYSLRLTALNSAEDLQKYIIAPATALIKGDQISVALPECWLDGVLIRYPTKELLTGK